MAEVTFFNHTAKGLTHVTVAAVRRDSKVHDPTSEDRIIAAIKKTREESLDDSPLPKSYLQIPLVAAYKLSGNYLLPNAGLCLHEDVTNQKICGHITFPIYSDNETERNYEGTHRAVELAAALSTLTQQLITVNDQGPWFILSPEQFHQLWADTRLQGEYTDDSGFLEKTESGPRTIRLGEPTREVIESRDCLSGGELRIPRRSDEVLAMINNSERQKQACCRFAEGLELRNSVKHSMNKIYLVSYELIAYVSSIEALLDSKREFVEINCPECGATVSKEEWKISEKYKAFVQRYTDGNPVLSKAFADLYQDRSKFVHTGLNLHNFLAERPNRPLILTGKSYISDTPRYYRNIHELTGCLLRRYLYGNLPPQL